MKEVPEHKRKAHDLISGVLRECTQIEGLDIFELIGIFEYYCFSLKQSATNRVLNRKEKP
jgi:hypothetical protein